MLIDTNPPSLKMEKHVKALLARPRVMSAVRRVIRVAERLHVPDPILFRAYSAAISLSMFRGWRTGLAEADMTRASAA